jgi:hypothetical protein
MRSPGAIPLHHPLRSQRLHADSGQRDDSPAFRRLGLAVDPLAVFSGELAADGEAWTSVRRSARISGMMSSMTSGLSRVPLPSGGRGGKRRYQRIQSSRIVPSKVNVRPRQSQRLGDPQPGRHEDRPERPVARALGAFDEDAGLVGVEDGALGGGQRRGGGELSNIPGGQPLTDSISECSAQG